MDLQTFLNLTTLGQLKKIEIVKEVNERNEVVKTLKETGNDLQTFEYKKAYKVKRLVFNDQNDNATLIIEKK